MKKESELKKKNEERTKSDVKKEGDEERGWAKGRIIEIEAKFSWNSLCLKLLKIKIMIG